VIDIRPRPSSRKPVIRPRRPVAELKVRNARIPRRRRQSMSR
jgi:hypothetical protein